LQNVRIEARVSSKPTSPFPKIPHSAISADASGGTVWGVRRTDRHCTYKPDPIAHFCLSNGFFARKLGSDPVFRPAFRRFFRKIFRRFSRTPFPTFLRSLFLTPFSDSLLIYYI
jgi:hypothetical protein